MEELQELDWSDQMNIYSVETIEALQDKLSAWEVWIVRVSLLGDNREAFVFFFPLLAGLSIACGAKLLWAAIFVEWSNLILKWVMHGDRPYWYIYESPLFTNGTRPVLRQFPNTCESGPGTPSGHLMMNVAIFFIFTRSICSLFVWDNRFLSAGVQRGVAICLYAVYSVWIALVFLSRLYIQAHFIHQCVLGVIAGLIVGQVSWRWNSLLKLGSVRSLILASSLFLTAGLVWTGMVQLGYDPMWSVAKAVKHCHDPVHVHVDTQPYFIMARFTGAAYGLGLALSSQLGREAMSAPGGFLRTLLACKSGVFSGKLATIMLTGLQVQHVAQFLTLSVGVHAILPYTVITTLPYILTRLLPYGAQQNAKKNKTL